MNRRPDADETAETEGAIETAATGLAPQQPLGCLPAQPRSTRRSCSPTLIASLLTASWPHRRGCTEGLSRTCRIGTWCGCRSGWRQRRRSRRP